MFNYINLKKIKTTSFLAILMAGTLIPNPAISGSTNNNGHGNNCDGIDSSNPGNGSPDGRNRNHNETNPNFDDEGRGNCSTNTTGSTLTGQSSFGSQSQSDMIKLSFLTGEFQCGRSGSLAEFELTVTTAQNSTPITLQVGDTAFVEASNLQDLDIDVNAVSGGSCISWSSLADPVFLGSNDSFPNYINPSVGTYNQTPLNEFQEQLSASEGFMLMELGGHRRYTTSHWNRNNYDWNDILLLYDEDPNLPPILNHGGNNSVTYNPGQAIDVIHNYATDPEGDTLAVSSVTFSANGVAASLSSTDSGSLTTTNGEITIENGQIQYTPNPGFSGNESFTYTIVDSSGNKASATITVTVNPTADNFAVTTPHHTTTVIVVSNYTSGTNLTINNLNATNGVVTMENGQIHYTPNPNFSGNDSLTYTVVDSSGNEVSGEITVTVNPVANNFEVATPHHTTTVIDISDHAKGSTLELDSVTVSINGTETSLSSTDSGSLTTTNGEITIENGQIQYTPNPDFNGSDPFSYTVKDSSGNKGSGEITVKVNSEIIVYAD